MVQSFLQAIDRKSYITLVFLFMALELANIVLMEYVANIVITIPQFLLVLFLIFNKKIPIAFLFHVIFTLTAFDNTSVEYSEDIYSYSECKLIGPFTLSYVNLGLIWLCVQKNKINAESLFVFFRKILLALFVIATTFGIIGLVLLGYRFTDFFIPFNYLLVGFIYLDILCRISTPTMKKRAYVCALCLIIAAPIATFISFFIFNLHSTYSGFDSLLINEEFMLAPLMFLFLLAKNTPSFITLFSIILYLICIGTAGRGGFFYNLVACLVACVYYIYFVGRNPKVLKIIVPTILFVLVTAFLGFTFENADSLALLKFNDLFTLVTTIGSLNLAAINADNVALSPYIRIAELADIIGSGLKNPLALIFGRGFGGQYTDTTQMLGQINMIDGMGAFPPEVVRSGKFGYAHSFLPMTLLWSGLLGLYFLLKIGVKFIKRIKYSPLYFASFTLFFYSFYFNPSIYLAVVFALYGAGTRYSLSLNKI